MLVSEALLKHKPANIARFVRTYMKSKGRKRFNGVAAKDPQYQAILKQILSVKRAKDQGNLGHVLNFKEGGMDNRARIAKNKGSQ